MSATYTEQHALTVKVAINQTAGIVVVVKGQYNTTCRQTHKHQRKIRSTLISTGPISTIEFVYVAPGMKSCTFSENAVLPDPEGPAKPTYVDGKVDHLLMLCKRVLISDKHRRDPVLTTMIP